MLSHSYRAACSLLPIPPAAQLTRTRRFAALRFSTTSYCRAVPPRPLNGQPSQPSTSHPLQSAPSTTKLPPRDASSHALPSQTLHRPAVSLPVDEAHFTAPDAVSPPLLSGALPPVNIPSHAPEPTPRPPLPVQDPTPLPPPPSAPPPPRSEPTPPPPPPPTPDVVIVQRGPSILRPILYTALAVILGTSTYFYMTDTRAAVHRFIIPPLLRAVFPDAEDSHEFTNKLMKALYTMHLHPRERMPWLSPFETKVQEEDWLQMKTKVWDLVLDNPIAISAGLDKNADIPDALFALGAGIVEVGGCTALPQQGNPRPRLFRIPVLNGLINRYGLNSKGADTMAIQLRDRVRRWARQHGYTEAEVLNGRANVNPGSLQRGRLLAVQIAKNKDTDERDMAAVTKDYVYCVRRLAPYADIIVVNVSSPNTPGLRDLQATEPLTRILAAVVKESKKTPRKTKPKIMVKVSPDEDSEAQVRGIARAVWLSGVDGVIVGNTTKKRMGIVPPGVILTPEEQRTLAQVGGYSGPQTFQQTSDLVSRYRWALDSVRIPGDNDEDGSDGGVLGRDHPHRKVIFASGGITTGEQANEVRRKGAAVAMVYTGLVYGGAGTITRLKSEMQHHMFGAVGL